MSTWYVRPDTSHTGTRNGTSYATAWGGWSEITWGVGGVVGGDTLYVCGAHSYSAITSVGAHGGSSEGTRCVVRGDYAADPGSITYATGSYFLNNARAWTSIRNLTISAGNNACIYCSDTATDCEYTDNVFVTTASNPFSMAASNGEDHARITIARNTFRGASSTTAGVGSAIGWFVTAAGAVSTVTDIEISDNVFDGFSASRAVIHLRIESDADAASIMSGITITGNTFTACRGVLIEAQHEQGLASIGGVITIANNEAASCLESSVTAGAGGFSAIGGFSSGSVYGNTVNGIQGASGFCNTFYGSYRIFNNEASNLTTTTIDGCGLLFDHGAVNCRAWSNTFTNLPGKAGTANSGVGIMVLDATGINCYGNIVDGCKWGVHLGAAASGQSCSIANNTMNDCADGAIFTTATADLANCTVKNNAFIGDGYSVYDQTAVAWSAENNNCFYGFASGASNHTLGAQSITSDPLLDANYRPLAGSPVIGAGVYIPGARDFSGRKLKRVPDIGARQYYEPREAVSPSRTAVVSPRTRVSTPRSGLSVGRPSV